MRGCQRLPTGDVRGLRLRIRDLRGCHILRIGNVRDMTTDKRREGVLRTHVPATLAGKT